MEGRLANIKAILITGNYTFDKNNDQRQYRILEYFHVRHSMKESGALEWKMGGSSEVV